MKAILAALLLFTSAASAQVLVEQPIVADVQNIALVDRNPPRGTAGVTLWTPRYTLTPTNGNMGRYTGFQPGSSPRSTHQVSVDPALADASGIQGRGAIIGINIHSGSVPRALADRSNFGIVLGQNLAVPQKLNGKRIKYSFDAMVPYAYTQGSGVVHMSAYYSFHHIPTRKSFWLGMLVFDLRGWAYRYRTGFEPVMWDQKTAMPIVSTTAGGLGVLRDTSFATAPFEERPYNYWQSYTFAVGPAQIAGAVAMLGNKYPALSLSADPNDYALGHINLNPEIYAPPGSFAHIGMSVKNWRLEVVP